MANSGDPDSTIDGLYKLVKDGFIEQGGIGILFKGTNKLQCHRLHRIFFLNIRMDLQVIGSQII